jgi:4-hydroxy-2-oxoglutarate aldolase
VCPTAIVYIFVVSILPMNIDLQALEKHVVYLARAGVRPLLAGTMGEGIHLAYGERTKIIHSARKALDAAGFSDLPIIAGAGGGSTRETVALCEEVAAAGADAAIVITPGYFAGVLANHRRALKEFFAEVAGRSPVPVIIYNCGVLVHPPNRCNR